MHSLPPIPPQVPLPPHPCTPERCLHIARACGLVVCALGLCVLGGWLFDCRSLMTLLPGLVAMKPNTAVALCLAGLSLFLSSRPANAPAPRRQAAAAVLASLSAAIGALTLAEYAFALDFGIDELLWRDYAVSSAPGRMAPISAFNLVCLGLSIILLRFPKQTNRAHALAGCAAISSLLSVVGLVYGVPALYESGQFTAVALHTAIAFLGLSAGVCCASSQRGFMRVVTGSGTSGTLLRRYGLAAVIVPFLFGWLRVQAVRWGWCSVDLGRAIVAVANAATLATLGWVSARSLRKAEHAQARTQEGLRESEERLNLVVEQLTEGLVIANLEGQMLHWNRAALEAHGFSTVEEGMRSLPDFTRIFELSDLDGRVLPCEEWPLPRVFRGETLEHCELRLRHLGQGWTRLFSYGGSTVQGADGKPLAFLTINDITRQREIETEIEAANERFHRAHLELEVHVLERTSELARANAGLQQQMQERARAEHANQQIMDHSLDVICTFDAAGRFVQVNQACNTLWGYRPEELIGRPYLDLVHPDDREKTVTAGTAIQEGRVEREFENRYVRTDGSVVPMVWSAQWSDAQQSMFCVARDITARKQVETALLKAKEAAEAASRAKSEFLANMSHEIRTPMNGIIGMTELVLDTKLDRSQREYLTMARTSAITLLGLINDILDFSKIEAGKLELESVEFNLHDCIGTLLKPLAMRADQKGLELTADIAADVPYQTVGDPMRLRQILINLTDNAIKFTPQGDVMLRVAVESATEDEHALHFTVADSGIGIPAEKQALIFEAFAQADGTTTRTYGGTGLGLAIASRLVEQMRGRIWVESTPGKGTAFHFTARFPMGKAQGTATPFLRPPRLAGLPVLVVDDNAINRRILQEMLINWHMRPAVVDSGEAALAEMVRAAQAGQPYPLVLLDGMMPGMDGFMAAEKIRANPEIAGATVMMLSSAMPADVTARCAELGVASYLTKPVTQTELIEAMLVAVSTGLGEASPATDPAPDRRPGAGLRILVAEDNVINRALATGLLEKYGHTLVHAANGREAVHAAAREKLDLIFMDVQMPEMDGLEATRRIREAEQGTGRHTPIAAMTAHAMTGDRERFLAAGMDDYISKPLQRNELFELLDRVSSARALAVDPPPAAGPSSAATPEPAEAGTVYSREEFLERLDGDEELLGQMTALFHENTPGLLGEIRDALARRRPEEVSRSTHAFLSSLGVVGAMQARQRTLEVSAHAKEGDYERAASAFAALADEVAKVDEALDAFRGALA